MLNTKYLIAATAALTFFVGTCSVCAGNIEGKQNMVMANETITTGEFASFSGTVTDINNVETGVFKAAYVSVQNGEDKATITIFDDAYVVDGAEIAVGTVIKAYFNAVGPMLMIYPPQYRAEVVVVENKDVNVKFDRFDKNNISSDGELKLNISDKTEIISQDGSPFDGDITDRKLVVRYTVTTRSIPAQTTPSKIIVLFEKAEPVAQAPPAEPFEKTLAEAPIRVNGNIIDAPNAFVSARNTVMVPLRAIAEALGYEVEWESETQSVKVGPFISLKIGEDSYVFARRAPYELKAAPELINGKTFVPISFFNMVVQAKTAGYIDGEVVINME